MAASREKRNQEEFTKLPKRDMVTPTKGAYKGHVSVKSSVYAATGCTRLANQNMVRDHLDAHYKKVNSAKSCIDNGKPKAWTHSTKKRDQLKRNKMKKTSNSRPSSRASSTGRNSRLDQDDDFYFKELDFDESGTGQGLLASSQNGRQSTNERVPRTMTPSQRAGLTPRSSAPKVYSGDVLDKMSTSFVAPARPYTPRTKKSSAQSWLSKSNVYNSPKKNTPPSRKQSRQKVEYINEEESYGKTVKYQNGLNDTFDKEPEETVGYAETSDWMSEDGGGLNDSTYDNRHKPLYNSAIKDQKLNSEKAIQSSLKIQQEEEELLYLEFVTDVTTDVLNRGVYTNRMLKQIFESHITNNKDRLDESRMQNLVQQLQQDLAIEDEEILADDKVEEGI